MAARYGVETFAHPIEAELIEGVDRTTEPGEAIDAGGLEIGSLLTPGHTAGMLNFVVNEKDVFTGDTLFRGSVGRRAGARVRRASRICGTRSWTC